MYELPKEKPCEFIPSFLTKREIFEIFTAVNLAPGFEVLLHVRPLNLSFSVHHVTFLNYPEGPERSLSFHHGGAFARSGYSVVGDFAHCNHHISCRNNQTLSFYASAVKERIRSLSGVRQVRFSKNL